MRSPATPAHALESSWCPLRCLPAVPVRPAAARRACSGGQRSASRTRPFATRSATLSASCHSAFSHAEAGVLWSLSPYRGWPCLAASCRRLRATTQLRSQVPARALCRVAWSHGASTSPACTAHAAGVVLSARPSHAAPTTAVLPPVHLRSPRHAMRGPADDGCAAGPQAWAGTRIAAGADPVTAPRGGRHGVVRVARAKGRAALPWDSGARVRPGQRQGQSRFEWTEGGAEGCWRQRFHSTETRGEPHTPKLRHGRQREREVRGREDAEGVQCAPRHASPARSAVRQRRTARGSGLAARRRMPRTRGQR
ncbi:hypothetical protein ERJ75_000898400 [Trypanosoma vivax]|nr:hypothetical protein ERJ75_000898400 [Trypanosoma vivax]